MGYLRFSLCLAVLYQHFLSGNFGTSSGVAVFGFYVLSGFLTARVMTEVYNNGYQSKMYFLANRALKVYPIYIICLLFSIICILLTHNTASNVNGNLRLPSTPIDWIKQFTIVGLSNFSGRNDIILLPTCFSLSTEIVYYFIIGVILGGKKKIVTWGFLLIVYLTGIAILYGATFDVMYFSIQGPAAVFFFGAASYHWQKYITKYCIHNIWVLIALTNVAIYMPDFINRFCHINIDHLLMCILLPFFSWAIISLHNRPARGSAPDKWCEDITYPVFLLQFPIAAMVLLFVPGVYQFSPALFFLTLSFCILVSIILIFTIERPMEKYRKIIRNKAKKVSVCPSPPIIDPPSPVTV